VLHTKGLSRTYAQRIARPAILEIVSDCDARADLTAATDIRAGLGAVFDVHLARLGDSCPPVVGHDDVHWITRDGASPEADLVSLFARVSLDIVHTHRTRDLASVAPAAKRSGVPCLVHTIVNEAVIANERKLKELNELAAEYEVVLVAPSFEVASRLGAAEDVAIVRPSIDCLRYRPDSPTKARQKTGLPEEPRIIGCASPAEGLEELFLALTAMEPDIHVALFGPAFPGSAERHMIREMNLDERVHVLGGWALPEVVHQAIDIYYHGPSDDCGSRPILAAQACGKPVVAGHPSEAGYLCPQTGQYLASRSQQLLVEALDRALSMSPATSVREYVETNWCFASSMSGYESAFRSAVELRLNEHDTLGDAAAGGAR